MGSALICKGQMIVLVLKGGGCVTFKGYSDLQKVPGSTANIQKITGFFAVKKY